MDFNENMEENSSAENSSAENFENEESFVWEKVINTENQPIQDEKKGKTVSFKGAVSAVLIAVLLCACISSFATFWYLRLSGYNELGLTSENFEKLKWGFQTVEQFYYGEKDQSKMIDGALLGMSMALDEYTAYMPKETAEQFMQEVDANSYSGVGLYISNNMEDNTITVISALSDSPAERAGIESGDKILAVGDMAVKGTDLEKASDAMLGEEGTKVSVTFLIAKTGEKKTIEFTREKIKLETVSSTMLEDNIGYIEITQFGVNTLKEFVENYNELCDGGMEKVIIDLRNNPGGYFDQAINMADIFIEKNKMIVYTMDKNGTKQEHKAKVDPVSIEMVILSNGGTASASEVFIGAMLDHNKATLIGEKTYGKGVTQALINYEDGSAFKVTDNKYYTPSGHCIDKKGIEPSIKVSDDGEEDLVLQTAINQLKK